MLGANPWFAPAMPSQLLPALVPEPSGPLLIPRPSDAQGNPAMDLSLVIPTYNEADNLQRLVAQLTDLLVPQYGDRYELIVVDDNSPDRTWQLAQQLGGQYPALRVMRRQRQRGLATAVARGWQVSRGQHLGVIDGDLQHPPEIILPLMAALERGKDLALASRHGPGGGVSHWNLGRRLLSRGAQLLGLLLLPEVLGRVSDPMSGYFVVRRTAIAGRSLHPRGYKILLELLARGDIQDIAEVGYVFQERQWGDSKISWRSYSDYGLHLLQLRLGRWRSKQQNAASSRELAPTPAQAPDAAALPPATRHPPDPT